MIWMSSHCGISGNERADASARAGHCQLASITAHHFVEARTIIRGSTLSFRSDIDVSRGSLPTLVPWQRVNGAAVSPSHHVYCGLCVYEENSTLNWGY